MKKITAVLFDLDGTLIGMNQSEFIRLYFIAILDKLAGLGYDKQAMYEALETAIRATKKNNGAMTNEQRFWQTLDEAAPGASTGLRESILSFYSNEFVSVLEGSCSPYPRSMEVINAAKSRGLRVILATNPLFPAIATHARIRLGGMSVSDFEYITAYENSSYCKPSPEYYTELLANCGLSPDECAVIGNDTRDDFGALAHGIPVFILTDGLINADNVDLRDYPHGSFDELIDFINSL